MNFFARQAIAFRNDANRCTATLLGIVQGMLSDGRLHDDEIRFLNNWLHSNANALAGWPGNALAAQVQHILQDGRISEEERRHLTTTLQRLIGGELQELAQDRHLCELALDAVESVELEGRRFCLTGDFIFGTRVQCADMLVSRGAEVVSGVSKHLHYLVVGSLGSPEWKHGSFGTKIAKAMALKQQGHPLAIVHEDPVAAAIMLR